jgi:alkylation response protein AidB-like acyl-CoA dehydrogenase
VFARTADQQLFEDTSRRFLDAECPLPTVRALAGSKAGYEEGFWQRGAELGWTSLLVPEAAGGGSVSGDGVADLAIVAYQFGLHAAPGPLTGSNVVAAAIGRWGVVERWHEPLAALLSGRAVGAWAVGEPLLAGGVLSPTVTAARRPGGYVLDGACTVVEGGLEATHLLVTARDGQGLTNFFVSADTPGLTVMGLHGLDLTRRFAQIGFDGVKAPDEAVLGEPRGGARAASWLLDAVNVVQLAEMCGTMTWAFDTTVEWAFNRYSFGRPLASYQELKHRFADMKMWLEASYAIAGEAARALDGPDVAGRAAVGAGKVFVGRYGPELIQDCVQMHGGIGVTFDHDLHLFLRRVTIDSVLFGSAEQHAMRLAAGVAREATG